MLEDVPTLHIANGALKKAQDDFVCVRLHVTLYRHEVTLNPFDFITPTGGGKMF
jgi:hypothetical protein